MKIQVLLSTMNKKNPKELAKKCRIKGDYVIINQITERAIKEGVKKDDGKIIINIKEKGLSKSRNLAINNSASDICLIMDDDVELDGNYIEIIESAFNNNPKADVIAFNLSSKNSKRRPTRQKSGKVGFLKTLKIQSSQIAFRRKFVKENRIIFDENFGAGSEKYVSGEDNIFLVDCLKKGAIILFDERTIADIEHSESTWLNGYNELFFKTKGAVFYRLSHVYSVALILAFAFKKKQVYNKETNMFKAVSLMMKGRKEYKIQCEKQNSK